MAYLNHREQGDQEALVKRGKEDTEVFQRSPLLPKDVVTRMGLASLFPRRCMGLEAYAFVKTCAQDKASRCAGPLTRG
jgi:hypothetical protein